MHRVPHVRAYKLESGGKGTSYLMATLPICGHGNPIVMRFHEDQIHWDSMVASAERTFFMIIKDTPGTRRTSITAIAACPDQSQAARCSLTGPSFATLKFITILGFAFEGADWW